jgi:hypothetical protein
MANQGQVAEVAGESQLARLPKQAPTAKIVAASAFGTIVSGMISSSTELRLRWCSDGSSSRRPTQPSARLQP